jgi:hypothetical protein
MIAALATLLVMAAGFLFMISGALSDDSGKRVRARAAHLVFFAVLMLIMVPILAALLRAVPRTAIIVVLAAASLGAFAILESRASDPRSQRRRFVSYRTSGKVPVYEPEGGLGGPDGEAEPGVERDDLL